MATPPTRVLSTTPAIGWSSSATPKTTPVFDVQNGDLLVYLAFSEDNAETVSAPTWTGTGTWTLRQAVQVTQYSTAYLYTCLVTATATGRTVSATSTGARQWGFIVSVWRNHGGVGVSGKANVNNAAPSLVLNTSANSALVMGNSDWNAIDGASRTWRSVNGVPIVESSYGGVPGVSYVNYTGYSPDTGAAGNKTVGLSAPAGQKYSIVGVEILGTTSGGAVSAAAAQTGTASRTTTASRGSATGAAASVSAAAGAAARRDLGAAAAAAIVVSSSAGAVSSNGFSASLLVASSTSAGAVKGLDFETDFAVVVSASTAANTDRKAAVLFEVAVSAASEARVTPADLGADLGVQATTAAEAVLGTAVSSGLAVTATSSVAVSHVGVLVPIQSITQWLDSVERPLTATVWDGSFEVDPTSVWAVRL